MSNPHRRRRALAAVDTLEREAWSIGPSVGLDIAATAAAIRAALRAPAASAAEVGEPVNAREVSHAAFELCEFIEDIADKPTDSSEVERFKAGQRYAAKSIRKGLGIWLTDEENRRAAAPQPAIAPAAPVAEAREGVAIYLVASGDVSEGGRELYERHEGRPPPLCDYEGPLFAAPAAAGSAEPAQPATQEAGPVAPDVRIYWHASRGWQVEWLTAAPNGGQSNYYHAAPQAPAAPAGSVLADLDAAAARKWQGDPDAQRAGLFARAAAEIRKLQAPVSTTQETP